MLAKEIIEDSLLSFLTQEAPDFEVDGEPISQQVISSGYCLLLRDMFIFLINLLLQVLSKIKVGPSSLALLAKTALMGQ